VIHYPLYAQALLHLVAAGTAHQLQGTLLHVPGVRLYEQHVHQLDH
jgi:hypothetical protein